MQTKGKKGKKVNSHKRTTFYMSQLDNNLKRKLYKLYQPDFKLFDYHPGHTI